MKKKILSLLVTMGLAASLVPVSVFADGTEVWGRLYSGVLCRRKRHKR